MKMIFTFTQGRTGTASLAKMFSQLPETMPFHEHLHLDSWGVESPDTATIAQFNMTYGMNKLTAGFWFQKAARIAERMNPLHTPAQTYVETSHLLGKAGLFEALFDAALAPEEERFFCINPEEVHVIFLNREPEPTIRSLVAREDFQRMENLLVWYLHPHYIKNVLKPQPFADHLPTWYYWEMEARKILYHRKFTEADQAQFRFPIYCWHAEIEECQEIIHQITGHFPRSAHENTADDGFARSIPAQPSRQQIIDICEDVYPTWNNLNFQIGEQDEG